MAAVNWLGSIGKLLFGMLAVFSATACTSAGKGAADARKAALEAQVKGHVIRRQVFWDEQLAKPLVKRVGPAPAALIDFLHLDNELQGWQNRPRAFAPDAALARDLESALVTMPPEIRRILERKLAGVYLVEDLGGSGYTDSVVDAAGAETRGFIVLDATVLSRRANEWATFKESSPYASSPAHAIEMEIEDDEGDTRVGALRYILMHEAGHVIQIGRPEIPSFVKDLPKDFEAHAFAELSWKVADGHPVSIFPSLSETRRKLIHYYAPADKKLPITSAKDDYERLLATNLPSPYAATNLYDDFAESVVTYAHAKLLKKPWVLRVLDHGESVFELKPCWGQPRCAEKEEMLSEILKDEAE